jgi:hypothetical protein
MSMYVLHTFHFVRFRVDGAYLKAGCPGDPAGDEAKSAKGRAFSWQRSKHSLDITRLVHGAALPG